MSADPARERPDLETATEGYGRRFSGPVGEYFLSVQWQTIRRTLTRLPPARSVLDVAGGHAQIAPRLAADGYCVTVLGSGPDAFHPALPEEPSMKRAVGDLLDLPFEDASFDIALNVRALPHLDGWERLVAELCRVSRLAVVVDYPTRRSLNVLAGLLFPLKRWVERDTRRFRLFSRTEIAGAFERSGYRVVESKAQFFFPMGLYRWIGSGAFARALETLPRLTGITRLFGSPIIAIAVPRDAVEASPDAPGSR